MLMEISSLKSLLNSINHLFHLSSRESICELALKSYSIFEEILRLLKPILEAIVDNEISSTEILQTEFVELRHCIVDVRDIIMNFQPLMSKFHFVIEVESLMEKVHGHGIQILELLQSYDHSLPGELSSASLEHCVQKIKNTGSNSSLITEAIKGHMHSSGASSESLANIADRLSLKSNQELLIEAVALEKLKENAELAEKNDEVDFIDQMINLVTHMHELLVLRKQSETYSHVSIPADFCCPLSLELMTDPVIVASGQTYEKAYIRRWIDLGLTVCPKTRQTLAHTNLIPNYTVKALISNWCESNNVKLPDPQKSTSLNQSSSLAMNFESLGIRRANSSGATDLSLSPEKSSTPSDVPQNSRSPPQSSCAEADVHGNISDTGTVALRSPGEMSEHSGEATVNSDHVFAVPSSNVGAPSDDDQMHQGHNRMNSGSSTHSITSQGKPVDVGTSHHDAYSSDVSGDLSHEPKPANQPAPTRESIFSSRDAWGSQSFWRSRKSDRFIPRVVNCPPVEMRPEFLAVEKQVKKLVEDLTSDSVEDKRKATYEIRLLARHNTDNRIIIANCGAISLLIGLLRSPDMETQENAVTALLNLSINDNNKAAIGNADAIEPLIYVLQTGSAEAKENAAATLFSLSVTEENKIKIGKSGAIKPLVDLLGNGTPRGKKDAATALFNLSINHDNKVPIVEAGAVRHLVELMDPRFGMVDKAVGVLSNLSTIPEGRKAIGQEGGIPFLVEVVELGSAKGKENAAAALLWLCTNSSRFCQKVLEEGVVPPLVALSRTGTPRAKEKANQLINYIRNTRHGNAAKS